MKRLLACLLVGVCGGFAMGQLPGGGPAPAPAAPKKPALSKEARIQYIINNLELTPEQRKNAQAIGDTYLKTGQGSQQDMLAKVQQLTEEYKQAETAGDKKRMEQITQEFRSMGTNTVDEPQFLDNLRAILTDPQKADLDKINERLKNNAAGLLRPIDLYRAAHELNLSAEQKVKLEESLTAYRESLVSAPPARDPASIDLQRNQQVEDLSKRLSAILTPEQAEKFNRRVSAMGPPAAPAVPTTGPARP